MVSDVDQNEKAWISTNVYVAAVKDGEGQKRLVILRFAKEYGYTQTLQSHFLCHLSTYFEEGQLFEMERFVRQTNEAQNSGRDWVCKRSRHRWLLTAELLVSSHRNLQYGIKLERLHKGPRGGIRAPRVDICLLRSIWRKKLKGIRIIHDGGDHSADFKVKV